ncbi:hypothetical protein [Micromonospora sp. DT62]|uniref:hypothetical protein n=1 Tax=Micromonospora sp. DT62 TaxID=3416521 RepID=UPI003CF4E828
MATLSAWVRDLKAATFEEPPPVADLTRRVLVPGFWALDCEGLIELQALGRVIRLGMPPEAASAIRWMERKRDGATLDDFEMALGAGLTLASDRRIEVLSEQSFRVDGQDDLHFLPLPALSDKRLVSPTSVDTVIPAFREILSQLGGLSAEAEGVLNSAISLHYGAVLLFDRDLAAAYTLVIAGIEALSRQFGSPPTAWEDWEQAVSWEKFAKRQGLTDVQYSALKSKLMRDKQLKLSQTFINYAVERMPVSFKSLSWREYTYGVDAGSGQWIQGSWSDEKVMGDYLPAGRDQLIDALKVSYMARSGFVHSGARAVSFLDDLFGQIPGSADGSRPLPFFVMRSLLAELIRVELKANSSGSELPDVTLLHDATPAAE